MIGESTDSSKHTFKLEVITQCLTERCQDCSRLYHSEILQVEIRCSCICHRYCAEQQQQVEKLVGTHSSVGSPEERQAVATTTPGNVKEGAIALMDKCSKTLIKTVNFSCALRLVKAVKHETIPLQVLQEEVIMPKRFGKKLAPRMEVTG